MVICVKIGTNEPEAYTKYHKLTHSEDILQVLKENVTTFGTQGDKHYFAIPVDVSHLPDAEVDALIDRLSQAWVDGDVQIAERLYYIDTSEASWLTTEEKDLLVQGEYIKCNIKPQVYTYIDEYKIANKQVAPSGSLVSAYKDSVEEAFNISELNHFDRFVSLSDFAKVAINKATKETLAQELKL